MSGHAVGMIEMGGGGGRTMVTADLTGSMPSYFSGINTTLTQVANTIGGEWGLVSHKDYSIRAILSNGQTVRYGNDPDFAFQVNTGWTNPTAFTTALKSLSVGGGGDGAECYSRVLWELTQPDTISRLGLEPAALEEAGLQSASLDTQDAKEGIAAILEKREPRFTGR